MLLRCKGCSRRPWFEDVDLELAKGEIVVVSGRGSGKTLFLRAIADLDPADAGTVTLHGRAREEVSPADWRAHVIYLHQVPVRLPGSVADNVRVVRALAVHEGRRSRPSSLDLPDDAEVSDLSGGEMQRFALRRALDLEPDVLLLDEPSVSLDAESGRRFEDEVRTWVAAGHGALWVSHDPDLAERLNARVVHFP